MKASWTILEDMVVIINSIRKSPRRGEFKLLQHELGESARAERKCAFRATKARSCLRTVVRKVLRHVCYVAKLNSDVWTEKIQPQLCEEEERASFLFSLVIAAVAAMWTLQVSFVFWEFTYRS